MLERVHMPSHLRFINDLANPPENNKVCVIICLFLLSMS